jgi:hypothetical protein
MLNFFLLFDKKHTFKAKITKNGSTLHFTTPFQKKASRVLVPGKVVTKRLQEQAQMDFLVWLTPSFSK